MTQIHEPGEVWHVGWDWHADLWFVEPPEDVELDDPILWFNERHQAFEFIDDWIRTQPVQASVVDEVPEQPFELPVIRHEDNPLLPPYVPKAQRPAEPVREPIRVLNENAADRVADYASRVGLG